MSDLVPHRLQGISPKAYEHPADRAATAALAAVPGLDLVIRKLIEFQYERVMRQLLIAGAVRVGPDQLPAIRHAYEHACATLDVNDEHEVYITQQPIANAFTMGAGKPVIVLNSGLVAIMEPDELRTVIGHELGHIVSRHIEYSTALAALLQLRLTGAPLLAGLPVRAVRAALLEWYRAAELTCDRAATLVNRDPLVTSRTLMVLAAGMPSKSLNLEAFLRQGHEYEHWSSNWDRFARSRIELQLTHDLPVRRVSELMHWIRSGAFDRIIGGSFVTRDREPPAREQAGDAASHYAERFRKIFREAGTALGDANDRLGDWLSTKE